MAIALAATRQALATYYGTLGAHVGTTTGAPGAAAAPANEASGGGYVRKPTTWTPGSTGTNQGSAVVLDVAGGGLVYAYMILCSAASGATQIDNSDISDVTMSVAGQIVITPNYNQT